MLCKIHVDTLLVSHVDLALRVVIAYQRQIWYEIPKTDEINKRCVQVDFC